MNLNKKKKRKEKKQSEKSLSSKKFQSYLHRPPTNPTKIRLPLLIKSLIIIFQDPQVHYLQSAQILLSVSFQGTPLIFSPVFFFLFFGRSPYYFLLNIHNRPIELFTSTGARYFEMSITKTRSLSNISLEQFKLCKTNSSALIIFSCRPIPMATIIYSKKKRELLKEHGHYMSFEADVKRQNQIQSKILNLPFCHGAAIIDDNIVQPKENKRRLLMFCPANAALKLSNFGPRSSKKQKKKIPIAYHGYIARKQD